MKALYIILMVSLPVTTAQAQYGGGTGEPNNPYLIYTVEHLNSIGTEPNDWDKNFKLMADIDYTVADPNLAGNNWPSPFCGVFDGNGHVISNFSYTSTDRDCIGFFRYVYATQKKQAVIKDLGLIDPNIDAGNGDNVGSLVGYLINGIITGCYIEGGSITGDENIGGLVGYSRGDLIGCNSIGLVSGSSYVGGLVGWNESGVTQCYSTGTVIGEGYVGGLVGRNCAGNLTHCYSAVAVTGDERVGGLVGGNYRGKVIQCFWDTQTSGQTISEGGTGKTTIEIQTAGTFLEAGWDFVDETKNGTEDIWWILEGQNYPRLWWQYSRAFSPHPQDGATDVIQPLILNWFPGGSDLYHDIYFGEDEESVANATTKSPGIYRGRQPAAMTTYDLGTLELAKTYYWRIDEVNESDPNSPWKGDIWSFTTADFIVVDDFESYDANNQVWFSWHDGLGYGAPPDGYPGNGTGSAIGDETEYTSIERLIVHGGHQSMPFYYHNNKNWCDKYSEAEKTLSYPRDWTEEGVTELSLWFRGYPAAGSFIEEPSGIYKMTGLGADIGANNNYYETDEFHFAYKQLTGPGIIVAKVESIENTHEWAKAGVMIREESYEGSRHAFVGITPGNGVVFQGRRDWGGASFKTNKTGITAPHWVKLEREDTANFTAYHSNDGSAWEVIGETTNIQMGTNVYVGLALTSHDSKIACEAKFSNVTITGSVGPDWADQDIGIATNDLEPMYVAIANNTGESAVVYHDDPGASGIDIWTEWVIPLTTFADKGIDLTDVNSIAIGIGTRGNMTIPGGRGKMYFDDIRLYPPRPEPEPETEISGELSNDAIYANLKIR